MARENALQAWRLSRGFTITECAEGAGIDRKQWRALENGEGAHFDTVDSVVRWCAETEARAGEMKPGSRITYESFRRTA
jgi:transcriptional regulator with XRE-family HTH domain